MRASQIDSKIAPLTTKQMVKAVNAVERQIRAVIAMGEPGRKKSEDVQATVRLYRFFRSLALDDPACAAVIADLFTDTGRAGDHSIDAVRKRIKRYAAGQN